MGLPMFDTLTGRLEGVFRKLRTRGKLHPKQVEYALGEMRTALLEAADLHRPGAVEQLVTLGSETGVPVASEGKNAEKVARAALKQAERDGNDVVIVDTAGRLHVDADMMREARRVRDAVKPHHVLMACDAMTGQDAVIQAREFMREIDVTGFVLTKLDGDSRGGAALSITHVTGRPIFFAGTGERVSDLEPFYPDRMASRILGMGDVMSLIEKAEKEMDQQQAQEAAEKMARAEFTLEDFLEQMRQVRKLGPLQDLLAMLPGVPGAKQQLKDIQVDEGAMARTEAIICSMTREERRNPAMIGGSRRLRIAQGSGTTTGEVNALLKQFAQARKMMKTMMGMAGFGGRGLKGPKGLKLPKLPPGIGLPGT